jgi:hypothetical protein
VEVRYFCAAAFIASAEGFVISSKDRSGYLLRTCVLLREPGTYSLRVLQKFVGAIHHALFLMKRW